jgi:hypothetical protein
MFPLIIKRYLPKYLLWSLIAFATWVTGCQILDGVVPVLLFGLLVATLVLGIPIQMYLDYRETKRELAKVRSALKGEGDTSEYVTMAAEKIAEKAGIPDFLVKWVASAGMRALKNKKPDKSEPLTPIVEPVVAEQKKSDTAAQKSSFVDRIALTAVALSTDTIRSKVENKISEKTGIPKFLVKMAGDSAGEAMGSITGSKKNK